MNNKIIKAILILSLVLMSGCSGIKMLSGGDRKDLYSDAFTQQITTIKNYYRRGDSAKALQELQKMNEATLNDSEKSLRRNLIGVIYFGKENYEQAIFNFNQGLSTSEEDPNLKAQIQLNLAGSYYKLQMVEKAFEVLEATDFTKLAPQDIVKFHKLKFRLASELGKDESALRSLIWSLSDKQKISELRLDPSYEQLSSRVRKLDQNTKYRLFEEFEEQSPLVVGYLAYLEAELVYYSGKKDDAKDLIRWVETRFGKFPEIESLTKNFLFKVENYARIDPVTVGVVLPLSGDKKNFGERALFGIDAALRELKKTNPDFPPLKIVVKDSLGSGVVGARQVKELVEKNFAAIIIGGLFSGEATKEFMVAKRRGVFFVSLSQIYLEKEQKDHLLLEVPGSIESQVNQVFSSSLMSQFGKRGAIVFPESKRGEAYLNEFWRKSKMLGVPINGVYSYDPDTKEFRTPIQNLLGLKAPRTRAEEYKVLEEIYSLEGSRSTRRIQTLKPQVDFDWVFIPSFPIEAVQIIPSFTYYDAFNVPVVGGPSWRSRSLSRESYKFRNIYFVGDDVQSISDDLSSSFYKNYGKKLRLIELRSFDSMKIAASLLLESPFSTRDELEAAIRTKNSIKGQTGSWNLVDGVWIKELASLHIRNGKILELTAVQNPEGQKTEAQ